MAKEFNYKNYLKNNPLLSEKKYYEEKVEEEDKKNMDEEMKKKSSKMKLSEFKAKIKERVLEEMKDKKDLDEMDAVAWNEKKTQLEANQ